MPELRQVSRLCGVDGLAGHRLEVPQLRDHVSGARSEVVVKPMYRYAILQPATTSAGTAVFEIVSVIEDGPDPDPRIEPCYGQEERL